MSTVVKDLGAVSAYAYAVEKGYTGTEAEFAELMADYAEVGQRAEDAADSALESKTAAQTAATTATNKASEATTAATTATTKAGEASTSASTATSAKDTAVSASQTATSKATEATTAAATATSAATTATTAKDDAVSAKTAAQTAQTGAETAAASVQSSAAQIATNAEDIDQLKSDLSIIDEVEYTLPSSDIIQGTYANNSTAPGKWVDNSKRIRNAGFIKVIPGYSFHFVPGENAAEVLWGKFANGSLIADSSWITTETTVTIPSGVDAIILVFAKSGRDIDILPSEYDATITISTKISEAIKDVDAKLNESNSELSDFENEVAEVVIGDNLCDPNAVSMGYYLYSGGRLTESDQYRVSDYIPVEVGETYYIIGWNRLGDAIQTRYIAELYDADKNPITGTYVNTDAVIGIPVAVSANNAVYIRGCAHLAVADGNNRILQVEKSTVVTYLKYYRKTVNNAMELPQIADLLPLEGIATRETGVNLLKNTNTTAGYINTKGGTIAEAPYLTSDYIPVTAGQAYVYSVVPTTNTRLVICLYDNEKNAIPTTYSNLDRVTNIEFTPDVDGYVRVSAMTEMFTTRAMITKGSTVPTAYLSYAERYELADNVVIPDKSNVLSGKKWCPCGDSFSAYTNAKFTSGQFVGLYKVYSRLIAERNDMNLVSTFIASGRTLAYPSDGTFHNSLTDPNADCYYQNIPADVDYITIMLGINDSHHAPNSSGGDGEDNTGEIPIGTITDNTTATYYGAWNVVLTWLITNRPFAHIGILVSNGCDAPAYREAQIAIAKKYGVPYIDLNGDERTPVMIRSQNTDIASAIRSAVTQKQAVDYDGTETGSVNLHPNYKAHEYESTFIEAFLRSI